MNTADVSRRSRFASNSDDDDSGCAMGEYTWVPAGLKHSELIHKYYSRIPEEKIPYVDTIGERYRIHQLLLQLPPHDNDSRYCQNLTEAEKRQFHVFNTNKKEKALGRGSVILLTENQICTKCTLPIVNDSVAVVCHRLAAVLAPNTSKSSTEKLKQLGLFHPECFVCSKCSELLVDLTYFLHNNKLFCGRHYCEQIRPRCSACDEIIFADECTEAESRSWHTHHFMCSQCERNLGGDRYILREGHPYCCVCFDSLFAELCDTCGDPIGVDEGQMAHDGQHWHSNDQCFCCQLCQKSLIGQPFLPKYGNIFCSVECSKIFAKKDYESLENRTVIDASNVNLSTERRKNNRIDIDREYGKSKAPNCKTRTLSSSTISSISSPTSKSHQPQQPSSVNISNLNNTDFEKTKGHSKNASSDGITLTANARDSIIAKDISTYVKVENEIISHSSNKLDNQNKNIIDSIYVDNDEAGCVNMQPIKKSAPLLPLKVTFSNHIDYSSNNLLNSSIGNTSAEKRHQRINTITEQSQEAAFEMSDSNSRFSNNLYHQNETNYADIHKVSNLIGIVSSNNSQQVNDAHDTSFSHHNSEVNVLAVNTANSAAGVHEDMRSLSPQRNETQLGNSGYHTISTYPYGSGENKDTVSSVQSALFSPHLNVNYPKVEHRLNNNHSSNIPINRYDTYNTIDTQAERHALTELKEKHYSACDSLNVNKKTSTAICKELCANNFVKCPYLPFSGVENDYFGNVDSNQLVSSSLANKETKPIIECYGNNGEHQTQKTFLDVYDTDCSLFATNVNTVSNNIKGMHLNECDRLFGQNKLEQQLKKSTNSKEMMDVQLTNNCIKFETNINNDVNIGDSKAVIHEKGNTFEQHIITQSNMCDKCPIKPSNVKIPPQICESRNAEVEEHGTTTEGLSQLLNIAGINKLFGQQQQQKQSNFDFNLTKQKAEHSVSSSENIQTTSNVFDTASKYSDTNIEYQRKMNQCSPYYVDCGLSRIPEIKSRHSTLPSYTHAGTYDSTHYQCKNVHFVDQMTANEKCRCQCVESYQPHDVLCELSYAGASMPYRFNDHSSNRKFGCSCRFPAVPRNTGTCANVSAKQSNFSKYQGEHLNSYCNFPRCNSHKINKTISTSSDDSSSMDGESSWVFPPYHHHHATANKLTNKSLQNHRASNHQTSSTMLQSRENQLNVDRYNNKCRNIDRFRLMPVRIHEDRLGASHQDCDKSLKSKKANQDNRNGFHSDQQQCDTFSKSVPSKQKSECGIRVCYMDEDMSLMENSSCDKSVGTAITAEENTNEIKINLLRNNSRHIHHQLKHDDHVSNYNQHRTYTTSTTPCNAKSTKRRSSSITASKRQLGAVQKNCILS